MLDIHNYDHKLRKAYALLAQSNLSEENKKDIRNFCHYALAQNMSKPRIIKYLCCLRMLATLFDKDFSAVTKKDVERVVAHINLQPYSPWTIQAYQVILKRFFQWKHGYKGKKYPACVEWISTGIPHSKRPRRTPHEFPTADDVALLVVSATSARDKAFIACLGESGCRVGEIGNLQISHLQLDEDGALLYVQGKTGFRPVRVVYARYYLQKWLAIHPLKEQSDAPLWVNLKGKKKQQLSHQSLYELLKKTATKASVTKKVNPHSFRHGRGTFLSHFLTGYQLCHYMGWVPGSNMPSVYIHMSGQDVDAQILNLHGLQNTKDLKKNNLRVEKCGCGSLVPVLETCRCTKA